MMKLKEYEQDVKDDDVKGAWGEYKKLVEDAMRQEAQDQVSGFLRNIPFQLKIENVWGSFNRLSLFNVPHVKMLRIFFDSLINRRKGF
jgi:hypothetical protein